MTDREQAVELLGAVVAAHEEAIARLAKKNEEPIPKGDPSAAMHEAAESFRVHAETAKEVSTATFALAQWVAAQYGIEAEEIGLR